MSFREKSAWISLLSTLVVWGFYFTRFGQSLAARALPGEAFLELFAGCTLVVIIVQVALNVTAAIRTPEEASAPADERERLIELKATQAAFMVLSVSVISLAFLGLLLSGASPKLFAADPLDDSLILISNGIVFALVIAEIVRSGGQIFYFRRAV